MNRIVEDATVKGFHHDSRDQLRSHLETFVAADNFGPRLKTLKDFAPDQAIRKA